MSSSSKREIQKLFRGDLIAGNTWKSRKEKKLLVIIVVNQFTKIRSQTISAVCMESVKINYKI